MPRLIISPINLWATAAQINLLKLDKQSTSLPSNRHKKKICIDSFSSHADAAADADAATDLLDAEKGYQRNAEEQAKTLQNENCTLHVVG